MTIAPPIPTTKTEPELDTRNELLKCQKSCFYFIHNYAMIYDASAKEWIPFRLWPAQRKVLSLLLGERMIIILKARQLGLTWLVLAYILWLMLFHPIITAMLLSRRDQEAMYILGDERLQGIYRNLPEWMRSKKVFLADSRHVWTLPNGSTAKAFPTSAGDSYTASIVFVDEADLAPDLNKVMRQVKPTIDGGGQIILLSRADKDNPMSEFKTTYRMAKAGESGWKSIFLPWHVRPSRDTAWYAEQRADILARTESLDDLHEQYPATDTEALAPKTLSKRIPPTWLEQCYAEERPDYLVGEGDEVPEHGIPAIPGLRVYRLPERGASYKIGIDPAEGNPTSDDSAFLVVDEGSGEEVASYRGKTQPAMIANYAALTAHFYNGADILPERNNHGHAVILWLEEHEPRLTVVQGQDKKAGWLSSPRGKTLLYDEVTETFKEADALLHSFDVLTQLQSIDGSTLRAPDGLHDDLADACALALMARRLKPRWRSQKFIRIGENDRDN